MLSSHDSTQIHRKFPRLHTIITLPLYRGLSTAVKWATSQRLAPLSSVQVFSQTLHTNTCHYLKWGHDHFVPQPYDSYGTSHPVTFSVPSEQMPVLLNKSYTNIWLHFQIQNNLISYLSFFDINTSKFSTQNLHLLFLIFLSQFSFHMNQCTT